MTETKFKRTWKDPVWSKVISVVIIALGSMVFSFIQSKIEGVSFSNSFRAFWTTKVQLWLVILLVSIYFIVVYFRSYLLRKKNPSFSYDDDTFELDLNLFMNIKSKILPYNRAISFLRHNNFAGFSFRNESLDDLEHFEYEAKKPDFEFFNPELEVLKKDLEGLICKFTSLIASDTFPTANGRQTVPPEWELEQPERFNNVVNELHAYKESICNKYDEFIKAGRKILKV